MDFCEHCKDMEETREQIARMYHIITGNGDPREGLVFKVAVVEEHVTFMKRFGALILAGAVGVPFTVFAFWLKSHIN